MNIYVSQDIKNKYKNLEFIGKPWKNNGLTWMKTKHKVLHVGFRFCFELGCGADCSMYEYICKNGRFA